jgi:hypothetical protein
VHVQNVSRLNPRQRALHLLNDLEERDSFDAVARDWHLRKAGTAIAKRRELLFAPVLMLVAGCVSVLVLAGCGTTEPGVTGKTASAGTLVISTQSVNFGSVMIGQTASANVSVSNSGSASVQIDNIQMQGASFSVTGQNNTPISVAAGKSYSMAVSFHPTATGATTGALILTSSQSSGSQVIIALSGTGKATASGPALTLQSTSVAFGNVAVNTPATQSVLLTSSGTGALSISSASVSGAGFSLTGAGLPVTLQPGQSLPLDIQFDPAAIGAATGAVKLATNTPSGTAAIALSGTGEAQSAYTVDLSWNAPTNSSDPVVGYYIYRVVIGGSFYQLLNQSPIGGNTYTDSTVQSGSSYTYYAVSVDGAGNQSAPSDLFSVKIP